MKIVSFTSQFKNIKVIIMAILSVSNFQELKTAVEDSQTTEISVTADINIFWRD